LAAYTYIIECSDGTLYTGWTVDLTKRIDAHNNGTGAKYTRGRAPVKLVYCETYDDRQMAQEREYALKRLTRKEKVALIATFEHTKKLPCG